MSTGVRHIGKYELRERLGRSGVAEVWKGFDTLLTRNVTIKLLHADLQGDPDFMKRFVREARLVASLRHPNIVQVHDFQISGPPETDSTVAYMVMDYIEGQSLADYIHSTSRRGIFPSATHIVQIFASISSAIDYAHQHGMLHRDIKPSNVVLDKRHTERSPLGEPVLTDFGIAKLLSVSSSAMSGSWLGDPLYMAPEQIQGQPGNERSDLYSLGIILYEICTGVQPFRGDNPATIMMQHTSATPTPPELINPNIFPALSKIILHSIAKNPADRFPNATSMTIALAEAFNVPLPEHVSQPISLANVMNGPTYPNPITPPPALPVQTATPPFMQFKAPTNSEQARGQAPRFVPSFQNPVSGTSLSAPSGRERLPISPPQFPSTISAPVSPLPPTLISSATISKRRRKGLIISLVALLILILGGSCGAFYLLSHNASHPTAVLSIFGQAFYVSSGQLKEGNSQGINDQLQVDLHNIPAPAPGNSYYAWLLSDKGHPPAMSILLGQLPVNHGNVHFLYPGNQQHSNLFANTSRFLITEEKANSTPGNPLQDQSAWRYYAELPQIPSPIGLHRKAIDTLRDLLYDAARLKTINLHGGSDIRLLRNTEKILEWAGSARDAWSGKSTTPDTLAFIRRQIIRILDYLDGASLVQKDVPANTPLLVDPMLAQIPLSDLQEQQVNSSYVDRMNDQLTGLTHQPGVTPSMRLLATQADTALLKNVKNALSQVHLYAKQLINLTDAQWLAPSTQTILDNLLAWSNYALVGRLDPSTGQLQAGVVQIHNNVQRLLTFDVQPYK